MILRKTSRLQFPALQPSLLATLLVTLLAACRPVAVPTPTPTATSTRPAATSSTTASPSLTPSPSPTPEAAWYQALDPATGVLKFQYAQVLDPGARIYASLQDAVAKTGNFGHTPSYPAFVAYTATQVQGEETYYHVTYGWMDGKDLRLLVPSSFAGIQLLRQVPFRFGWVLAKTQSVNAAGVPIRSYQRYQVIHEVPTGSGYPGHIAIGPDEWLAQDKVALVSPGLPADVGPGTCRFIYANLNTQTLSVFDDCRLVFATLISSGKNSWTFTGRFTILNEWAYSTLTPPAESTSEYYIEDVPYFMSYAENFGFHAAYWHDDFGSAASHGCINLSPTDAKWLYTWAHLGEVVLISRGK